MMISSSVRTLVGWHSCFGEEKMKVGFKRYPVGHILIFVEQEELESF